MNGDSVTCRTNQVVKHACSWSSEGKGVVIGVRKNVWRNNGQNLPMFSSKFKHKEPGNSMNHKPRLTKTISRHIITKFYKWMIKRKIFEEGKKSHVKYRGAKIRITANFSSEAILTRRQWKTSLKWWKKNIQLT